MGRPASNKSKGRLFQQKIRDMLLVSFPELHIDDIRSTSMGCPGEDLLLSHLARCKLGGIQIECKKSKSTTVMRWYEQAQSHGPHEPIVISREDGIGKPALVTMNYDFFIKLIRSLNT